LEIERTQPTQGRSGSGGFFLARPGATIGADGKFRFCELNPGTYLLTAWRDGGEDGSPPLFGVTTFTLADQDVRDIQIAVGPGVTLSGEVAWDGPPPPKLVSTEASIVLQHLTRTNQFRGESLRTSASAPGSFAFSNLLMDSYRVLAVMEAPGVYVKEITYAGSSVLTTPLRLGTATGNATLRITFAHDGGMAAIRVADKDSNPIGDAQVYIMPAGVVSEAALQARLVSGPTNQNGLFETAEPLPPGKYHVVATDKPISPTPDSLGLLWRARLKAKEVEIVAGATPLVTLEPMVMN
jgi:hypothetical protein